MCDKAEFNKIRDRVEQLEKNSVKFDEQLRTLFNSTRTIFWTVCFAGFLMLLSLIYGALGHRGFNAVTNEASRFSDYQQWSESHHTQSSPTR